MVTPEKKKSRVSKADQSKSPLQRTVRGVAWTFPKVSLEDALRIPKAIEDMNAGKPWRSEELAKAVGFNQSADWRFLDLVRASNLYGLSSGSGATSQIALTPTIGNDVVAPSSPTQRQKALLLAFRNVGDFEKVEQHYSGKKIPEGEFFLNTLVRDFSIPRDRVEKFAEVFVANLAFLRAFTTSEPSNDGLTTEAQSVDDRLAMIQPSRTLSQHARPREFLETCFVMMPFGSWFDRYYQEIYINAIKDAGFEPVRADELFSTGSVVEQIWEQILKAKVLLADLTDKNANVFYELGLAHAAKKPVVFTARRVEDIPFDLRHLRVLIYETQEPNWSETLKRNLTDFLKNAAKDPEKSIPNPFRSES